MGTQTHEDGDDGEPEQFALRVDDRGRITIPQHVRDRLGIEASETLPARLTGTVLRIDPKPSTRLETATAGRDDWANSTPTDAGESLFGPMTSDRDE